MKKTTIKPRYLTVQKLAEYCDHSVRTIRNWLKDPDDPLPCFRPGGRKILISRPEFNKWMKNRRLKQRKVSKETVGDILDKIDTKEKH
ncbi:MAG: helix-turn-helix domain-containing protein [Syntrophales bacterium]